MSLLLFNPYTQLLFALEYKRHDYKKGIIRINVFPREPGLTNLSSYQSRLPKGHVLLQACVKKIRSDGVQVNDNVT